MSSPNPPKRPPSSTLLPAVDVIAPGAIHQLRPIQPMGERPTVPPPIPHDAKPAPLARPVPRTKTAVGMPAPPSEPPPMREKLDSVEVANGTLLDALAEKNTELAAKNEAIQAAEARAEKLRLELEAAKVIAPTAPSPAALERAERHVAWLKVAGALVAILGAGTTYLSIRANSVIEPRVDVTQAKQEAAKLVTDTDHSTQLRVLEYLRADRARQDCVEAQIGSALVRGTGHRLTGLSDSGVEWAEQQRPPTKPAALWEHSVWFTVIPCAVAPHPP